MNNNNNTLDVKTVRLLIWFLITANSKWQNHALMNTHYNDMYYSCPLNSLCQCANLPNETYLHKISCNEVSLYKFPEFIYSSVKHVDIQNNHIQTVDDETFQGLRLESLKIMANKIHHMSDRSLSSMAHSLISLDISGNEFQQLPLAAIRNIHTLTRLNAQSNQIQTLNGDWGNMVDTLRTLHLSNNSLFDLQHANDNIDNTQYINASTALPIKSFSKLRKLVWLDLSKNRINHIGPNYLPRLLVTLDLSRNIFQMISTNMFEHLHELKILSMKDNLISKVTGIELMNKLRLEKFDLSMNNIDALPTNVFNGSVHCKAINFDKNFISFLPENVFMGLGTVHMVLSFNVIHTIDENAFVGLENTLEYLDLERNQLKEIPTSLLTLKKIRYLYLTSNTLSNIESLPNTLRVLSLAGNNLTHIPLQSLQSCSDLTYLNMGYNKIVEIQENGFNDWGNHLQTLLLRNNKITRLNYGTFNGLDSIKEISLSFNDIHYVHPMVFENISKTLKILELSFGVYREDFPIEQLKCLTELIWLGLDNNNLKFISDESLITMKELTYINLSFNRIVHLPRNIFMAEVHKSLMDVDLSHNSIQVIYPYTFDSLDLQFVNLGFNRIHQLEKHSFNNLPYLQYIDLAYNNLKNVTESALTFLPSLLHLDLMFNEMESFTMKLFKHVSNETLPLTLNISNNKITWIDGEISSFLYIGCIDASNNLLTDTQSFKNLGYALRILYLHGNNISNLTNHAFGDLEALEILDLSNNKISGLRRRSFYGLLKLQELKLNNNEIEQLQVEQFSNLKKLRILDLSYNKLKALPREVFLNTRLEYLNVANNLLGTWPVSAFSDVGFTLRNIQFNENQLEYLDSTMFINTQFIFELNLGKNKLQILPDNTFTFLNNLTDLDLSYNPIVTTNLKEILHHTPRIRKLNLNAMGLYSMPNVETALNYLTELDLSMNYLQDISPLNKLKFLRVLRIAQNKLTNLTNFGDRLPLSLKVLDISWNPWKKTQLHDFMQIRYLEELYMENVKVTNSLFLSKLHNLKVLRIHSSFNFGDIILRINGLQKLYIVMNESTLDDNFLVKLINHTKINLLEITGNRLTTITPNAFYGLSRNQKLHLRITNTQIAELPPEIFYTLKNIPHLSIDLSNNRISSLSPDSFYPTVSIWDAVGTRSIIGGLDLYGNALQCDCGLVWLGHWLRRWLRETAQMNIIPKEELKKMLLRARKNTCIDQLTGNELPFLEIFPEDLLCHASALSSLAVNQRVSTSSMFIPIILIQFVLVFFKYFM